jgi:oligo-1,6-glucosidase
MSDPWWKRAVIYQIWPRGFAGDLAGIRAHADHLADLGVDGVWLCPVFRSPQRDAGYDVSDYYEIDPRYGTLADFDGLLADLHARGIRLLVDIVLNHTSHEHPWFEESRASRDSPRRDWYVWRDEPNDWRSEFSGPAWTYDATTGQHYLHTFAPEQPDLNWENPEVREAMYAMMRWWLRRGVDGLRLDAVQALSKPPGSELRHDWLRELRAAVGGDALLVAECGASVEQARALTDPARREVDMVFGFEHVQIDFGTSKFDPQPFDLRALKAVMARWQGGLGAGWNSLYFNNHDHPRAISRWGDGSPECARCLATLLHLHQGTPFVYQGEELGMPNAPLRAPGDFADVESRRFYDTAADRPAALEGMRRMARDHARTPIPWDEAARQRAQPGSVLDHYRRLIALRHADPVVVHGEFALLDPDDPQVYAFTRTLGDATLHVACNVSAQPAASHGLAPWETRVRRLGPTP